MNRYLEWFKCAAIRAVKTFAQVVAALITVDGVTGLFDINWGHIVSVAAVSMIYSFITSAAGLPELDKTAEGK